MSESLLHANLARSLSEWIAAQSKGQRYVIYRDLPELPASERPRRIDGFCPDIFCASDIGDPLYVGEAKTARDLESAHTRNQLTAFLRFLAGHAGAALVIAVPWRMVPAARSLVRALQRITNTASVPAHFLDQLPG